MRVRTDVCGSFRLFFVCAQQCAQTALLTAAHSCAQLLTAAHRRLCASVRVCAHLCASIPFYSVRICAHSVRMRTTTICCAQCAQPLRTDILCCAHSVRILCACSPTSVRSAQTLAVRILCALRTDVCGSFTPCLCAAHRLRTDAHRLSTLLIIGTSLPIWLPRILIGRLP